MITRILSHQTMKFELLYHVFRKYILVECQGGITHKKHTHTKVVACW